MIGATLLVALAAACSFQGDLEPGLRCGDGDLCPGGQTCIDSVCRLGGDDAVTAADAMTSADDASPVLDPDAGGSPDAEPDCTVVTCAVAALSDDFAGGGLAPLWFSWNSPTSCTITEASGSLTLAFTGAGTSRYCGIDAEQQYDLRTSAIFVDAGGAASAPAFTTFLQLSDPADFANRVEIFREQTWLVAQQMVAGVATPNRSITYSATAHRYWRIRGGAGRVYFETSASGATWTPWFDAPALFDLSAVVVTLGAGHYQSPGGAVVTSFAGVNQL